MSAAGGVPARPLLFADRLSDAMLRDLVENFSALELTIANLPEDELGQGYEYLIKKFADDSGYTAAEFYTNRRPCI
jgi:type I restriction enzyme M protein